MEDHPYWFKCATSFQTPESRIKIRVEILEEGHSGYCSDEEPLDVHRMIEVVYLPDGKWDFGTCVWEVPVDGHCCCGAMMRYRILSIERLSASST